MIGYVEEWDTSAVSRSAATNNYGDHIDFVIFDKNGYMYTNAHDKNLVRRYPPSNYLTDTIIVGTGSSVTGTLKHPTGIAIDSNLNLYINDQMNTRIAKWSLNAPSLVTVMSNTYSFISTPSALLVAPGAEDQLYISDEMGTGVYLWTIGAAAPSVTFTNVFGGTNLGKPRGIKLDPYGNLYVADQDNSRIVIYCVNSTMGTVIVKPVNGKPLDIAFDSHLNLYAIVDTGKLFEYALL